MKIGILTSSISRKAGGLLYAIKSLAIALHYKGCNINIFSAIDDWTEEDKVLWDKIPLTLLKSTGPSGFCYMPELNRTLQKAKLDVLHNHGNWMYTSIAAHNWGKVNNKPYIISPHGMLDVWAIKHAVIKKMLAGLLYERSYLKHAACIHALSQGEINAIRKFGLTNPVCLIPNGINLNDYMNNGVTPKWYTKLPIGSKVLLYLGRIHPKKGIKEMIQSWEIIHSDKANKNWHLVITGFADENFVNKLHDQINNLSSKESIHIIEPQFDEQKISTFYAANALILPSYSEGLPMVVLEAWACCLPVLMTKMCNYPDGFNEGAAIQIHSVTPEAIADSITKIINMNDHERYNMGKAGISLIMNKFNLDIVGNNMTEVYKWLTGNAKKPGFIQE